MPLLAPSHETNFFLFFILLLISTIVLTPSVSSISIRVSLPGQEAATFSGSSVTPISIRKALIQHVINVKAARCDKAGAAVIPDAMKLRASLLLKEVCFLFKNFSSSYLLPYFY